MANTRIVGSVRVEVGNENAVGVVIGTTTAFLGPAGTVTRGTGDYIHQVVAYVTAGTTGSCQILLADGTTSNGNLLIFGTLAGLAGTHKIELGLTSKFGPWRLTTGAHVNALALGRFT